MSGNLIGGKYEIVDVLGRGTAGTIYAAKEQKTGKDVALKSLHSSLTNSTEEAESSRPSTHRNRRLAPGDETTKSNG